MTKNGPQLTARSPLEIAVLCYPGSQATSIHGLTDLFAYADSYAREQSATSNPVVRITHWRPDGDAFECAFASHPGDARPPAVVIVPGSQIKPIERGDVPECVAWIRRKHSDGAVIAAVCGGQANVQSSVSMTELAERVALGERTFLRRFVKATRMRPSEYHQKLRIARSQELLELTRDTVDQIAVATGYEDPGGFRRTFKRVVGLSPSEYRRRFQRPV